MDQKFYICETCGKIVAIVKDTRVPLMCCGSKMKELIPGTTDASHEKHVPVWTKEGSIVTVSVGAAEHPMTSDHFIQWVSLQTTQGLQCKTLQPGQPPKVCFALCEGEEVETVFAYCNLHSMWKS